MKISVIALFAVITVCNALPQLRRRQPGCDLQCIQIYSPVCGSDGKTYVNACMLEVAKCDSPDLELDHEGECSEKREEDCDDICTLEYAPVCGSDGATYSNSCTFEVAQCNNPSLTKSHDGRCD